MTTSGSVDYELDAEGLITKAFQKLGIRAAETPLEAFEIQDGLSDLNLMLKSWQMDGMHLWTRQEGIVFLDVGKADYLLGASGDEATLLDDFIGTTATAAHVTSDTVITVSDSTGMAAADFVGIKLDDGTRHWTTIVSVDSSEQITITTGLASASASASTVFTYTTIIQRPLRITSSRRKTYGDDNEVPIDSWSREEYFNQVNKNSEGTVIATYYSPLLVNGRFYVWQTASSANDYIRISFERTIEDVDASTDTLDIPVEWHETVIYNLAARLVDSYTVPSQKQQQIIGKARYFMDMSLGWDQELESIDIQPDFR